MLLPASPRRSGNPEHVEPSDYLVSRSYRELSAKVAHNHSMWKVRALAHQSRTGRKRRKIAGGLEVVDTEEHEKNPGAN